MIAAILDVFIGAVYGPKSDVEKKQGFIGFSCKYCVYFNKYWKFSIILIDYIFLLLGDTISQNMFKNFESFDDWCKSFWCGFSIFFPAVSGFLAGTNKSGELKVINFFFNY